MAKIDFIVPCYNYAHYLPTCINSILSQSLTDIRVLIVNDASPDNTREVADSLARQDKRVTVLHCPRNQGLIGALNEGLRWASADYLLAISADDMLAPGASARAVEVMDANPDIGMVYGQCTKFTDDEVPAVTEASANTTFKWERYEGSRLIEIFCETATNFIETPTVFVRTNLQKAVGEYLPQLPHCCDFEMWLRLAAYGAVANIIAVQGYRRDHPSAMNKKFFVDRWPDFQQRKETFDTLFANHGARIPNTDALKEQIARVLGEESYWSAVLLFAKGKWSNAYKLMQFSLQTRPQLKYCPPVWQIHRLLMQRLRLLAGSD